MPSWAIIAIAGTLLYVICSLILHYIQDYFLFHPEKLPKDFEFEYNWDYPYEEIKLYSPEGDLINGILFEAEASRGVVFYFKGNTRSIKGWSKFSHDFVPKGWDFFMIDYPGFGKSTGKRSEQRICEYAQQAYDWLKEHYPEDKIVIYGRSLGSGFAAQVAAWNHPRMLILDSSYYSFDHLAQYYTFILPAKWIVKYHMPIFKYIRETDCPVHLIHGNQDWLIPYVFSPMLKKVIPDRATLYTIPDGHHNNLPKIFEYHDALKLILNGETPESLAYNEQKNEYYKPK